MKLYIIASVVLPVIQRVNCAITLEERAACNKDNLLNAFTNPTHSAEASTFCSAYISVPLTSTTTTFPGTCTLVTTGYAVSTIHPLYLYNLHPLSGSPTPISYNSASPSPSTVPGGAQNYYGPGQKKRFKRQNLDLAAKVPSPPVITPAPSLPVQELVRRASTVRLPTWLATTYPPSRISSACSCISPSAAYTTTATYNDYTQITTATCTTYSPSPTQTYPAFCSPGLQVNAPQPLTHANWKVTPNFAVASKMDCCAACAAVFNCAWWKFDFGTPKSPWQPGQCHFAYYIGKSGDVGSEAPAICPNGVTQGINASYPYPGVEAAINQPGYNFGACGNVAGPFESSIDEGLPDNYYENECGNLPPPYYTGQCDNAI